MCGRGIQATCSSSSVPNVVGLASPPYVNIAEMKNTGFDLELGYRNTAMVANSVYT